MLLPPYIHAPPYTLLPSHGVHVCVNYSSLLLPQLQEEWRQVANIISGFAWNTTDMFVLSFACATAASDNAEVTSGAVGQLKADIAGMRGYYEPAIGKSSSKVNAVVCLITATWMTSGGM